MKCSLGKLSVSDFMAIPVSFDSFVLTMSELNASIMAGTISVAMIVGYSSGFKLFNMTLVAVPGPDSLSWMTESSEIGAKCSDIAVKRLRVAFPVCRG